MSIDDPVRGLVGRHRELAMFEELLVDVRAQRARALVLRGEAGVGKTALLDHLAAESAGCRVLRTAGVESEMELAFAGLHQLCAPVLDGLGDLPSPQRDALSTAFGLSYGEAPNRFLVGLAVLSLLTGAADDGPLVCLIDDAQWLDEVSAQTLAFVARRLLAEAVAIVFCIREPSPIRTLDGLPTHLVTGLTPDAARSVLESVSPGRFDERVRDRIIAETRGNPLALLELPRTLTAGDLAGGFALPATTSMANHIEESFVRRVELLPAPAQRLLRLAAAEPVGDPDLLRLAAARAGIGPDAEVWAQDEGLIEFGPRVRFRHPLVRSAAYRTGTVADRREAHGALAEATDPRRDPDRRAWHLAHAANGPDEALATDLEQSAERARQRGGLAAAAAFLERAAELTPDPARRADRSLAAAQAKFDAGAFAAAERLVAAAELDASDPRRHAHAALLRARISFAHLRGGNAANELLNAARRLVGLDERLAREAYLEAIGAAVFASGPHARDQLGRAAEEALTVTTPARPSTTDLLLAGAAARFTVGYPDAVPPMRAALDAVRRDIEAGDERAMRWFWMAWLFAGDLWDDGLQNDLAGAAVRLARDAGALADLPIALTYQSAASINAGRFATAAGLNEESESIATSIGLAPLGYAMIMLAVWRGDDQTLDRFTAPLEAARERGEIRALETYGYTVALLNNGLARYEVALAGALEASAFVGVGVRGMVLVELIEAAARCGAPERAAEALEELEVHALAARTNWSLGMLARSRALLDGTPAAEIHYVDAIGRLEQTKIVVHAARARLIYGEWLRREQRRREAREQLRLACDTFENIGAEAFASRSRGELLATGETARRRTAETATDLTPQEARVARLAAVGHTNPEIGSELFISPRTVEYHLRKVFTKLGVSTRRELRRIASQIDP